MNFLIFLDDPDFPESCIQKGKKEATVSNLGVSSAEELSTNQQNSTLIEKDLKIQSISILSRRTPGDSVKSYAGLGRAELLRIVQEKRIKSLK
jgi:hypothetical protein